MDEMIVMLKKKLLATVYFGKLLYRVPKIWLAKEDLGISAGCKSEDRFTTLPVSIE